MASTIGRRLALAVSLVLLTGVVVYVVLCPGRVIRGWSEMEDARRARTAGELGEFVVRTDALGQHVLDALQKRYGNGSVRVVDADKRLYLVRSGGCAYLVGADKGLLGRSADSSIVIACTVGRDAGSREEELYLAGNGSGGRLRLRATLPLAPGCVVHRDAIVYPGVARDYFAVFYPGLLEQLKTSDYRVQRDGLRGGTETGQQEPGTDGGKSRVEDN